MFLKGYNHRFESDPEWGELLDRLRLGLLTEDDYDFLDSRVLGPTLRLPKQEELEEGAVISYACPTNALRNRITENNFQEMLKHTHPSKDSENAAPKHSVIIKGVFRGKKGMNEKSEQFHRLIYNTCGDDNIVTSNGSGRVDPCLKLTYGSPIMVSDYKDIEKGIVKGVTGVFVGLVLKEGFAMIEEIWSGYKINTIRSDAVEYIICEKTRTKEDEKLQHFILKPKMMKVTAKIRISDGNHLTIPDLEITQFPMNLDEATTGHKLQGTTKSLLAIADYNYGENWIYVALSRLKRSIGLFLFKKLNRRKPIRPSDALLREIETLEMIEQRTLAHLQQSGFFPPEIDITLGVTSTLREARRKETGNRKRKNSNITRKKTGSSSSNITRKETGSSSSNITRKKTATSVSDSLPSSYEFQIDRFLFSQNLKRITGSQFRFTAGNCLFDSVAFQVPVWKQNGIGLRLAAIAWAISEYCKEESDFFRNTSQYFETSQSIKDTYGKNNYLDYLSYMKDPKVYATELDIYMLTKFLDIGIKIYLSTSGLQHNEYLNSSSEVLLLLYNPNLQHYEPVIQLNTTT